MRSFIKSHKKANSLDESPSRIAVSPTRTSRQGDYSSSQRNIDDLPIFDPSTPSQIPHNSNGTKHSPGFESFHRLANKKMFTAKLFKKNSSTSAIPQVAATSGSYHDMASISDAPSRSSGTSVEPTHFMTGEATIPAIKGTITHNWGDNTNKQQPVIILNNPSETDSISSQDLEPAFRITSLRRDSAISAFTTNSQENALPRTMSADDQLQRRSEFSRDRHVYNELCKVKSKNRQARIHSHDDIISFEKASTVSLDLLESTLSPLAAVEDDIQQDHQFDQLGIPSEAEKRLRLGDDISNKTHSPDASKMDHLRLSVSFEDTPRHETEKSNDTDTEEDESSMLLTPDVDEEDDDTSKFSFELSGLNGRTSSVKYYSKPEPKEAVYIDDVYDDEDFDEDLNFYEDDLDGNDYQFNDEGYLTASTANGPGGSNQEAGKPVKRYNDLFDLSDDPDDFDCQQDTIDSTSEYDVEDSSGDLLEEIPTEVPVPNNNDLCRSKNDPVESHSDIDDVERSEYGVARPVEVVAAKCVKSFADIFNIDDDDEDSENEDESEGDQGVGDNSNDHYKSHAKEGFDGALDFQRNLQNKELADVPKGISINTGSEQLSTFDNTDRPNTPVHIFVTPPVGPSTSSATVCDPHMSPSLEVAPLPPPARSQNLKIHDLNSSLDSEVPGLMSNLYFIDETEEDKYNEKNRIADDEYLDEINTVPEDFDFSDSEQDMNSLKSPLKGSTRGSFRSTHSYSSQPIGAAKESTPTRNKLEIKNKTVTFFNYAGDHSPTERSLQKSPQGSEGYLTSPVDARDEYIISPIKNGDPYSPVTPTNSFNKPKPDYLNDYSLSPIQETSSSVDNSPSLPLQ